MMLHPGQLIGDASVYSGLVSPVDVVARSPAVLAKWNLQHLREITASKPELRAKFLQIVSTDLAAKLRDMMASSFSAETVASAPPPSGA
jgi:CRP-like cAMP-binding protein